MRCPESKRARRAAVAACELPAGASGRKEHAAAELLGGVVCGEFFLTDDRLRKHEPELRRARLGPFRGRRRMTSGRGPARTCQSVTSREPSFQLVEQFPGPGADRSL